MIVGDAAGFLNSMRLKGVHLAFKTGMLAARRGARGDQANDFSANQLKQFEELVEKSWVKTGTVEGAQLPSGFRTRFLCRHDSYGLANGDGRPRICEIDIATSRAMHECGS